MRLLARFISNYSEFSRAASFHYPGEYDSLGYRLAARQNELAITLVEALVPDYLPAVPTDPFDGQQIRYNPTERRIYFIGSDLQDHGGSPSLAPFTPHSEPTLPE